MRILAFIFMVSLSLIASPVLADESLGDCDGIVWGAPVPQDVAGLGLDGLTDLLNSARRRAATDLARAQLLARRVAYGIRLRLEEGAIPAERVRAARRIEVEAVELAASIWERIEERRRFAAPMWREAARLRLRDPWVRSTDRGLRHALARARALEREFELAELETEIEARLREIADPSRSPEARIAARLRLVVLLRDQGDFDGAIDHAAVASADLLKHIGPCTTSLNAMLLEAELRARQGDPRADLVWLRATVVHRELGEFADREVLRAAEELNRYRHPSRQTAPAPTLGP